VTTTASLATPTLVVALDTPTFADAMTLIERLAGLEVMFKVGHESLFGYGQAIFDLLEREGQRFFIDAKLHDIPRTVAAGVRALVRPGAAIINVHALGGNDMMVAAVEAAAERAAHLGIEPPEIFAVTLLTSIAPEDLGELGFIGGPGETVMRLAALARDARCSGVVCSAREARDLKQYFGHGFKALCPGIRPSSAALGDQKRVTTPRDAVLAGADYLVVGRPIVEAADPAQATRAILDEIAAAAHG
jgi:orotidine-5'-phosphate decarboxylase